YFAMDHNRGVAVPFVENTFFGPRLVGFDAPTLVFVPNEVVYKSLSGLNCPALDASRIQDCQVLFASIGLGEAPDLARAYPGRVLLTAKLSNNVVKLEPYP